MSYLVLARKSRPQTFADVVGQKAVVRTLQNALRQGRVPHALIFSGVRGTGKTTLARIMAKALNCENGPAEEPCNRCRTCREMTDGGSVDLLEIDGASNRGIQEIRELKEKIRFLPTGARYKIIIIDEVHMLTTEAFNALLKTLEEPPAHVYFLFATTELHKVPITILSRCQRYELKRLGQQELATHFARLAAAEGVQIEDRALDMIVREAGGSVRDGLSLLDQVFSYCGSEVRADEVVDVLGLVSHQLVARLGGALLAGDLATTYSLLDAIYINGTDIRRLGNDLLEWVRGVVICKVSRQPERILDLAADDLRAMQEVARTQSLETLSALFSVLLSGLERLSSSLQPRLAMELTFIRAVQHHDVLPVAELIARFDDVLAGVPAEALASLAAVSPVPAATPPAIGENPPPPSTVSPGMATATAEPAATAVAPQPPEAKVEAIPLSPATPPPPVLTQQGQEGNEQRLEAEVEPIPRSPEDGTRAIRQRWDDFLRFIHERQPWMSGALRNASTVRKEGNELVIRFADSADCLLLKGKGYVRSLTEFALDFFQEDLRIRFEVPDSLACEIDPANGLMPQQERRALAGDPLVLTALDVFNGQIGDIRVGERYRKSDDDSGTAGPVFPRPEAETQRPVPVPKDRRSDNEHQRLDETGPAVPGAAGHRPE